MPRSRNELYRDIVEACPDIGIAISRKLGISYGGALSRYLRGMVEEGLLQVGWEPSQGFSNRRKRVRVYRATEKGLKLANGIPPKR